MTSEKPFQLALRPLSRWLCGTLAVWLLLAPAVLRAREPVKPKPYALIFGTVFDAEGRALYGVTVKIRRANEKKTRWELYSNHSGEFAQRVPVGPADYVVWADVKGFKADDGRRLKPGEEVKVHIDGDERQDIGLHLAWQ